MLLLFYYSINTNSKLILCVGILCSIIIIWRIDNVLPSICFMVVIQDVTYYIIVRIETDIFSRRSIDYLFLRTFLLPPLGLYITIPKFIFVRKPLTAGRFAHLCYSYICYREPPIDSAHSLNPDWHLNHRSPPTEKKTSISSTDGYILSKILILTPHGRHC